MDQRPGKVPVRKRLLGILKADQVICFRRKDSGDSAESGNNILSCLDSVPSDLSVQGMFKVIINCSNTVLMSLLVVTSLKLSHARALLQHGSLSFGCIPEIKTEVD